MILRVHDAIYQATDGRLGHRMVGVPTLLLRSTGRKSGEIRTNSLTYARAGEDYLLVASNGGSDKAPAWLHNIRANGQVEIQIGRKRMAATAREVKVASPASTRCGRTSTSTTTTVTSPTSARPPGRSRWS